MVTGTLEVSLRLGGCTSLKDKRQILRSLLDRARREFQVAIAEVGDLELWGNATLGVACVSNNSIHAESILQHVLDMVERDPRVEVEAVDRQFWR